ncbi:loganic acid O-methyltransferase-like [Aristolochia californica]|uniref:loganic acid O-methyltransferase-like n=1 Tax=Aristolochia californica TaxID=171875 RepID=UPI0035D87641
MKSNGQNAHHNNVGEGSAPSKVGKLNSAGSYPMNEGDGPTSYSNNSHYQGEGVNAAKQLIAEVIAGNVCVEQLSSLRTYHVADLGCSVGPNTFAAVENIIGAVEHKLLNVGSASNVLDIQVSFNDHTSNDFNTLFASLPTKGRRYLAAGVPGSFHGRLFPKASLHFVHSSYALHWLSQVPNEVKDENSAAWNKGKILHVAAKPEVEEAYSVQFTKDMDMFLLARAEEVAVGGFMVLIFPYTRGSVYVEQALFYRLFHVLELALNDMATTGRLDKVKVNAFNLPVYIPYAQEIQKLVQRNGSFSIEKMQPLTFGTKGFTSRLDARQCSLIVRAPTEGIVRKYLGSENIDETFERYVEIAKDNSNYIAQGAAFTEDLFVLLKRKG